MKGAERRQESEGQPAREGRRSGRIVVSAVRVAERSFGDLRGALSRLSFRRGPQRELQTQE